MKVKYLHFRVTDRDLAELQQMCKLNKVTLSKYLSTVTMLSLNDYELQERVLKEAKRIT